MSSVYAAYQKLSEINALQAQIIDDLFMIVCQQTEISEIEGIISKIEIAAKENEKREATI